ncbi:MAG: polyketide synthase dehydratase domain-containing protein [Caldilineaceae bacterium]
MATVAGCQPGQYLEDHRIWDNIIFPGSGYVEIGLAVA